MSTETKITCDRCGHEFIEGDKETSREMYLVSVNYSYKSGRSVGYGHYNSHAGDADWCKSCCEETGIWRKPVKADEPKPQYPSLEDLVREIAREEAQSVAID